MNHRDNFGRRTRSIITKKAAVYDKVGGPEVMRYADVPDPVARRGGLVIEIKAIGIQGGDLIKRRQGQLVNRPHVVGYQASGLVRGDSSE